MKKTINIPLSALAAYTLFKKSFEKAGLPNDGKIKKSRWSFELMDKLQANEQIAASLIANDWIDYQNYLRDSYNRILKFVDKSPEMILGFEHKITPLFMYIGVKDYKSFNKKFDSVVKPTKQERPADDQGPIVTIAEPVSIPVLYTSAPFGRFDILRNPDNGIIRFYANGDFIFEGDEVSLFIKPQFLTKVATHAMFGDDAPWVKIKYIKEGKPGTAYFAQIEHEANDVKPVEPQAILRYLNKK